MTPPDVVIYTTMFCPYCHAAKALLGQKGVSYDEIKVDGDRAGRRAMSERAGGRTSVPQIFINGQHVGGYDELHALDTDGKLDPMLTTATS